MCISCFKSSKAFPLVDKLYLHSRYRGLFESMGPRDFSRPSSALSSAADNSDDADLTILGFGSLLSEKSVSLDGKYYTY